MTDKSTKPETRKRSLAALLADTTGNTIAIMAASLLPLTAMAGSAIDMSRLYVAKVRLQQACDAGALAGRRFMVDNTLDENSREQATKFFNFNFPEGWFRTTSVSFEPTLNAQGQVEAVARATVPMIVMQAFGKDPVPLSVNCEAKFELSNTDVMFVLDVTGSMNCPPGTAGSCGSTEPAGSKISELRTAVVDFYDVLAAAVDKTARLRIGFVPYSSSANVGASIPQQYLVSQWTYQSRERRRTGYNTNTTYGSWTNSATGNWSGWTQYSYGTDVRSSSCTAPSNTTSNGSTSNTAGSTSTDANDVITTTSTDRRSVTSTEYRKTYTETSVRNGTSRGNCLIETRSKVDQQTRSKTDVQTPVYTWDYKPVSYDTSQFKAGNSVSTRTGSGFTMASSSWGGCIEEADTVSNSTFSTIPSGANDLNIDLVPSSDQTRWRPAWPDVVFDRSTLALQSDTSDHWQPTRANSYFACPKAAQRLNVMTRGEVQSYLSAANGFVPIGGTYHDVGMIWGARFLSPTGIFSADNSKAPNDKPILRHIIFMTDGDMAPNPSIYGLYGFERYDRRVTGGVPDSDDLRNRHNERFKAACAAARKLNITIWVVAYAQAMTPELTACADPGKAFFAADGAQLKARFKMIAAQIAELRLSK